MVETLTPVLFVGRIETGGHLDTLAHMSEQTRAADASD